MKKVILKNKDINIEYSMQTDNNYPFQPPKFYIKNIEY